MSEQSSSSLVINELLCFVVNKSDCLPPEAICQLCLDTFNEDEIEKAKKLLYEHCDGENTPRMVTRKGPKKKSQNMDDIIKLVHDNGSKLPKFVALNLQALPPVSFNSLDVSCLLHTIKQTQTEVSLLKDGLATQARTISDLFTMMGSGACATDSTGGAAAAVQTDGGAVTSAPSASSRTLSAGGELVQQTVNSVPQPAVVSQAGDVTEKVAGAAMPTTVPVRRIQAGGGTVTETGSAPPQTTPARSYAEQAEEWKKMGKVNGKLRAMPETGASQSSRGMANHKPKPSGKKFVSGSVKQSGLQTVRKSKYASVFASRFDTSVSSEMLKSYLEEKLKLTVQVSPVRTRYDSYHSFHVMSQCDDPAVFMDESVWPEGAYVRWWKGGFVGQEGGTSKVQ